MMLMPVMAQEINTKASLLLLVTGQTKKLVIWEVFDNNFKEKSYLNVATH